MAAARIDILLPWKEHFSAERAGAVALCVRDAVRASRQGPHKRVLGRPQPAPFAGIRYATITAPGAWFRGRNRAAAVGYLATIRADPPALVEVHNRPLVARLLARRRPDVPVVLVLHNDARTMRGATRLADRRRLLAACAAVLCVSEFVRQRLIEGLGPEAAARVHTVHTGVPRPWTSPPAKAPVLLFVGRITAEKGVLELARAAAAVLPRHPGWRLEIVGAPWFGTGGKRTDYQRAVEAALAPLGAQVEVTGFLRHDAVVERFGRAAIAIVPSLWDEPLGRTAIEALAAGCALVTTDRGGLPEIAGDDRAVVVPAPDGAALTAGLTRTLAQLLDAPARIDALGRRAWVDYPLLPEAMAARIDAIEAAIIARFHAR